MPRREKTTVSSAASRVRRRDRPGSLQAAGAQVQRRPPNYARWRAATLIGVYVLFAVHIAHWKISGKTLAPLELNEVMYTLEHGVLTAGFIFMSLAVISVVVFGRFFCSWGCHILALQDLSEWLLRKVRIRPKPIRSRVLLLVPVGALLYMFAWPQAPRLVDAVLSNWSGLANWSQQHWPALVQWSQQTPEWKFRILTDVDKEQWASFVTNDFWRNLPGPWVTAITFLVVGFIIVYLLGTRSFCTYGCPYGVLFGLADRIAPGKIKAAGPREDCADCGLCTAACQSHIRVHEELTVFGRVVNPACLKDLDCVSACPNGEIKYGFTWPGGFKSWRRLGRFGVPYDFTFAEDVLMTAVFFATLFIYRGLYEAVPFLMCLGLGAIMAYGAVMFVRLWHRRDLRINNYQLRRDGRLTTFGWSYAVIACLTMVFSAHSALIRYHEVAARSASETVLNAVAHEENPDPEALSSAIAHFQFCHRWGLVRPPSLDERLATLWLLTNSPQLAEPHIRAILARSPATVPWRLKLASILLLQQRADEAILHLRSIPQNLPPRVDDSAAARHWRTTAHEMLGDVLAALGDRDAAMAEYRSALRESPDSSHATSALAELARLSR